MTTHALSMSRSDWHTWCASQSWPKFRADQISDWIFARGVSDPKEMSNLAAVVREELAQAFSWHIPEILHRADAPDGATKLLLKSAKGQVIEAVILRYEERTSLCVSSQVGCKMACTFCQTGKLGFVRHLECGEIIAQYLVARRIVEAEGRRLSHVVFMGMGEPLDNFAATSSAVKLLTEGFGLSWRHVTISTSGIVPGIEKLAGEGVRAALAVSLHAAREDLRTELMPINRKYSLDALKEALQKWQQATGDLITFEYILIKDKNCGPREARELVKYIHGLRAKVNLIAFNPHPGLPYERPTAEEIRAFQSYLAERSIPAPVRYSKGLEVSGACGQLAAKTEASFQKIPERRAVLPTVTLH